MTNGRGRKNWPMGGRERIDQWEEEEELTNGRERKN